MLTHLEKLVLSSDFPPRTLTIAVTGDQVLIAQLTVLIISTTVVGFGGP